MTLTLRPTGLAPPVYADLADYELLDDGQSIGRMLREPRAAAAGAAMVLVNHDRRSAPRQRGD